MNSIHWITLAVGIAIGFFVLPAVLSMVQGSSSS